MGTCVFTQTGRGSSMRETFRELQQNAAEEHGHEQGYSGDINCTELVADYTREYHAAKDKKKFLAELENKIDKRDCYGICLEPPKLNTNKVKSTVTPYPQKGARVWETHFLITAPSGYSVGSAKTQGEAIKKARAYAEKNQCRVSIGITKTLVKGNSTVAMVSYKASKTETKGKYLFVVAAPE